MFLVSLLALQIFMCSDTSYLIPLFFKTTIREFKLCKIVTTAIRSKTWNCYTYTSDTVNKVKIKSFIKPISIMPPNMPVERWFFGLTRKTSVVANSDLLVGRFRENEQRQRSNSQLISQINFMKLLEKSLANHQKLYYQFHQENSTENLN